MNRKQIEQFLSEKKGYLKKSPLETATAMWKISHKHSHKKDKKQLQKEVDLIAEVQSDLRRAKKLQEEVQDSTLTDIYDKIIEYKNRPKKILLLDIEVSPNIVSTWRIGNKVFLSPENIIKERAIICVAYKWYGEQEIKSLQWKDGDDKDLLVKFSKLVSEADIVLHQNGDSFDIPWIRTRCIFHKIPFPAKINSLDTLKYARWGFYFNSNKLDYLGKYLGVGQKVETPKDLWTKVAINNDKKALKEMVEYCKRDIQLLEDVYNRLKPYLKDRKFKFVL